MSLEGREGAREGGKEGKMKEGGREGEGVEGGRLGREGGRGGRGGSEGRGDCYTYSNKIQWHQIIYISNTSRIT